MFVMCGRLKIVKYLLCVACFFRQLKGANNMDYQKQCNNLSTDKVLLARQSLCFVFVSQLKTWDNANKHCQTLHVGGRLLEIPDINIRSNILGAKQLSPDSWIGLRLNSTQDKQKNIRWTSGTLLKSNVIEVGRGSGLCAAISPGKIAANTRDCQTLLRSLCEIDLTKTAPRATTTASKPSFVPSVIDGAETSNMKPSPTWTSKPTMKISESNTRKKPITSPAPISTRNRVTRGTTPPETSESTTRTNLNTASATTSTTGLVIKATTDSQKGRRCEDLDDNKTRFTASYGDYCYIYVKQNVTFKEAADICLTNYSGNLVYIPNNVTEKFLHGKLEKHQITSRLWIGFWQNNGGSFVWKSGGFVNYSGWAEGYPKASSTSSNCHAAAFESKYGYHWVPLRCSEQAYYICERALETSESTTDTNPHTTSSATIYYIIAAVVGAVLLAVFLIILCWRLKSRRRGRPKIEMIDSSPEHCYTYVSPEEMNLNVTTERSDVKEEQALLHNEYDIANVGRVKPNNKKHGIVGDVSNYDHAFATANNINGRGTSSPFEGVYDQTVIGSDVRTPGKCLDATYDRANFEAPSNFEGVYDCTKKISTKKPCGQKSDSYQFHPTTKL